MLKNLPGLGEFFNTPADGDKSNLNKALKAANVALAGLKPLLDLLASIEKAWNGLSADQQGTIFDTAIYLWLGSKGFKILKNIFGVAKDMNPLVSVFDARIRLLVDVERFSQFFVDFAGLDEFQ